MKKTFPLVCLVSLTMVACSSMRFGDWPKPKEGQPTPTEIARSPMRPVNIYIVADSTSEDVSIDEEPIHRKPGVTLPIIFQLATPGYAFPATGAVTFDDPKQSPPPGEIVCATTTTGPYALREVVCSNAHKVPGKYAYSLHLISNSSGTRLDKLDPFIGNH